ncbi:hypothetical protein TNCT_549041 [Trichonephila clavata]|uniref:Uncharacterized protein n=1 Tax=Trichonephila clavata TaxID=2740835 RepID=A0A8X6L9X7_TRICU|nr:hypothetical protein TNCT_549041 [Trichonephila clavata]
MSRYLAITKKSFQVQFIVAAPKHPEIASEFAARPVAQNFYNFPLESLVRITANIMIRFLHTEKILKEQNAESLALAYIKSFENSAKRCNNEFH